MAGPYPPHAPGGAEGQPAPGPAPTPPSPTPTPACTRVRCRPPVGTRAVPARPPAAVVALGLGLVAALVVAVLAFSGGRTGPGRTAFTDAAAKTTIQNYLDALSDGDTETVARNTLCGMFDAIKDRKSDLALARLASDAFRKQFTQAQVTSIDRSC